jgi:hypothetical protein
MLFNEPPNRTKIKGGGDGQDLRTTHIVEHFFGILMANKISETCFYCIMSLK